MHSIPNSSALKMQDIVDYNDSNGEKNETDMSVLSDSINSYADSQTSSQIAVLLPWNLLVLCAINGEL